MGAPMYLLFDQGGWWNHQKMNDQTFDSLNRKVPELSRKLESLMTNANKQISMIWQ